jgi:hypothetical protein
VFYAVLALAAAILLWKHRGQLAQVVSDLLREILELFARLLGGRRSAATAGGPDEPSATAGRRRSFAEFQDPFATGTYLQVPPDELVRYTFEAFEAWARDGGHPRTPDQTPHELVQFAVTPQTPLHAEARRLAQLYCQSAYGSGGVSRDAANGLQGIWKLMHQATRANHGLQNSA